MSTMPVQEHSRDTVLTMFKTELLPAIQGIQMRGVQTAKSIADDINPRNVPPYLLYYYHDHSPSLFVTRRPETLFGVSDTLYTITSTLALERNDGKNPILVPTYSHIREFGDIHTHRGIGIELTSTLMRQFGSNMGDKDQFVWLGSHIDPEQLFLDDEIARKGPKVDEEMKAVFLDHTKIDTFDDIAAKPGWARQKVHPLLKKVVEGIIDGRNLYTEDSECKEYVDRFMDTIHENFGLRDGWYAFLGDILKNKKPPPKMPDIEKFADDIVYASMEGQPALKPSQAVVLAVDAQKLFASMPIYPFPLTARPPETLVPAGYVYEDAIKGVYYFRSKPKGLGRFQNLLNSMSDLPREVWLQDRNDRYVTPFDVEQIGIDPNTPICIFRYNQTTQQVADIYTREIVNGNAASWNPQDEYLDVVNPKENMRALVYRNLLLQGIQGTGILERLTAITGDRDEAIERILTLNVYNMPSLQQRLLPSVSSLIGSLDPERDWR